MDFVQRLFVVIWMYAAALLGMFAGALCFLVAIGVPWAWSGHQPEWTWVDPAVSWCLRAGALVGVWYAARGAGRRFPMLSPVAILVSGVAGATIGVPFGHILAKAVLPSPSVLPPGTDMPGDLVALSALCCFGIAVLCGSFWRRRPAMAVGDNTAEQEIGPDGRAPG
jgi:hypothetical protein